MLHAWALSAVPYLEVASMLVVACAALHDIAARTVPNQFALLLAALGICARILDLHLLTALAAACAVFAIAAVCWRRGWMGGGDVKLLSAAALAVPPGGVPTLIFVMGMAGGILSLFYLAARRLIPPPSSTKPHSLIARTMRAEAWRIHRGAPLPYACAIAAGAVFVLL